MYTNGIIGLITFSDNQIQSSKQNADNGRLAYRSGNISKKHIQNINGSAAF